MMISVFRNAKDPKNPAQQDVDKILRLFQIKDDFNIAEMASLDEEEYDRRKKELPVACFGGSFSERSKTGLIESSGFLTLDFDKMSLQELIDKRRELKNLPFTYAVFRSPSGKGLKALVRIPKVASDAEYKDYYRGVKSKIDGLDDSGKDISRACFWCYDPEIYIHKHAVEFTEKILEEEISPIRKQHAVSEKTNYNIANGVLSLIRNAQKGERHDKILKASILMGGYVAGGEVKYEDAERMLIDESNAVNPDDRAVNEKTVYDGLNEGSKKPLTKENSPIESEIKKIELGKIYFTFNETREEVNELWNNGMQRGHEIGLINKDISIKRGCTTYIYAAPAAGKSQIWFEWLVNISVRYGEFHVIFSPETGGAADIYIELIEIYARADFYDTYGAKMDADQRKSAEAFVDQHFIVLDPDDGVLDLDSFFEYVDEIEEKYKVSIFSCTIDPWNELEHDFSRNNGREDAYLSVALGKVRKNARSRNRHNCILTHVVGQAIETQKNPDMRYYPMPTYREVAGGQTWSRKGLQMIGLWRPKRGLNDEFGIPYPENTTVVEVQKSKPKGIGKVGRFELYYNIKRHSYFENLGTSTVYASRSFKEDPPEGVTKVKLNDDGYPADWG